MKNLLILTHTFPINKKDSTAAFMKPFSDAMVEVGFNTTVLTAYTSEFSNKDNKFKVITYKYIFPESFHKLGYSRSMSADIALRKNSYILIPFMIFFGTISLVRNIRAQNIELVNVHWILPNGLIAYFASLLTGTKYVVTLPGTDVLMAHKNSVFGYISRIVANRSSGIVSNSSWLMKKLLKIGGINDSIPKDIISYPTDVTYLKPDTKGVGAIRNKYKIRSDDLILLVVGRLVFKKGYEYLIKALPEIIVNQKNTKLIIIGDGDLEENLTTLVEKLDIVNNVIFAGTVSRDEISAYYNLADIMVAPSVVDEKGNADGGPVVVLESMACAKPQVLTNILGMADHVVDGEGGYVVKEKNSKELARAIVKLAKSKDLRDKMGKRNRKFAVNDLSIKGIGKRYKRFYEKIS